MTVRAKETTEQTIARVAQDVARRYAKRCTWAEERDLQQEAWLVLLEVRATFYKVDPERSPDHFGAACWSAAMRHLSRYLWKRCTPFSIGDHSTDLMRGVSKRGQGLVTAFSSSSEDVEGFHDYLVHPGLTPEEQTGVREFDAAIRVILEGDGSPAMVAAVACFLDGEKPARIAHERGIPIRSLYRANEAVAATVNNDSQLRQLALDARR